MVSSIGQFGYPRRRSIFGGLVMIAIGSLCLLANFDLIAWWRLEDWFSDWWPAVLVLVGLTHLVGAVRERR